MFSDKTVHILVVEDDDIDFKALQIAFGELKVANPVSRAENGMEALEILRGENGREKLKQPYMILLDLNMPLMGGLEFLDEIRADETLAKAIVFVLSTSTDDEDICGSYKRHIAGYISKNNLDSGFLEAVKMIDHYWKVIEFPSK